MFYLIKDHRDDRLFIDDGSFLRNFESLEDEFETLEEVKEKHPEATDLTEIEDKHLSEKEKEAEEGQRLRDSVTVSKLLGAGVPMNLIQES